MNTQPFHFYTVLCLCIWHTGVNRDRTMTCTSRGHYLPKLYSASCGYKHTEASLWPQLLLPDVTNLENWVVHSVGSLFCLLQPCSFSPGGRHPQGLHSRWRDSSCGGGGGFSTADSAWPPPVGCPPPPPQPAASSGVQTIPSNAVLNSTGFCLFV